jgi:hypothetical protein
VKPPKSHILLRNYQHLWKINSIFLCSLISYTLMHKQNIGTCVIFMSVSIQAPRAHVRRSDLIATHQKAINCSHGRHDVILYSTTNHYEEFCTFPYITSRFYVLWSNTRLQITDSRNIHLVISSHTNRKCINIGITSKDIKFMISFVTIGQLVPKLENAVHTNVQTQNCDVMDTIYFL